MKRENNRYSLLATRYSLATPRLLTADCLSGGAA